MYDEEADNQSKLYKRLLFGTSKEKKMCRSRAPTEVSVSSQ